MFRLTPKLTEIYFKIDSFVYDRTDFSKMTPQDVKKVTEWHEALRSCQKVRLNLTPDEPSSLFQEFGNKFDQYAPSAALKIEKNADVPMPGFKIGDHIWYRTIPSGKMLPPFLMALADRVENSPPISEELKNEIAQIDLPTPLTVYVAPGCPFCPTVVTQLISLAALNDSIELDIIDGSIFTEKSTADHIRSAPTVLLDDQFRWVGSFELNEIISVMQRRDPADLSQEALIRLVEAGNANELANLMLQSGTLFPAFLPLLTHEKWPIRLGAMVAYETIAGQNKAVAAQVTDLLWEKFHTAEETIKGDILYSLGLSKDINLIPKFMSVIHGAYDASVKEAAQDAMDSMLSNVEG